MVSPTSYRYDCVTTEDPSGRCDHFLVRADTIKDVKLPDDRSVYITVNAGADEFLGTPGDIRRISDLLIKASKQGK